MERARQCVCMMYAHECDLMCMCKVQYHMPPVCLELLITTVSLWICSIQEVVPPETMLQTVYPKSLQMQRSKLNICLGNNDAKSDLWFLFLLFLQQKTGAHEEYWGASKTWSCFKLSAAPPLTPRHHHCLSVKATELYGLWKTLLQVLFLQTNCEEMAGKLRIITNLWNLWKEGSETLLHVHFEAVRISLLLQKTFPLLGQLYTLYYIYWIYWQSKIKKS